MAGPALLLSKASQDVQHEHEQLMQRLRKLDRALDALVCYAEVYADLASSAEVAEEGRWLSGWLPGHFVREEETVLAGVALLGPEFAAFAREMKRQHREIGARAAAFCEAAACLPHCDDLQRSICDLKEEGKRLTGSIAAHMDAEERTFATIK